MARYEHLPIFREAYDLSVHIEKIVRNFSRYHKYTLGTDLRNKSRSILGKIVDANNFRKRRGILLELRQELEGFKVLSRLCHDSGGFASTRSYLHVAERITGIARQNEGWIKKCACFIIVRPFRLAFGRGMIMQAFVPQWGSAAGGPCGQMWYSGEEWTDYTRLYWRAVEQLLVEYYLLEQYDKRVEREPERWQREQRQ